MNTVQDNLNERIADVTTDFKAQAYDDMAVHLDRLQGVVARHGLDGRAGESLLGLVADKLDAAPTVEQIREIAWRAYAAGCGVPEFHEADCQEVIDAILRDVLPRPEPASLLDFDKHMDRLRREREVRRDRIAGLVEAAAAALPGQVPDAAVEVGDHVVTVQIEGDETISYRLRIPAYLLVGVDPDSVPNIVQSYVDACFSGRLKLRRLTSRRPM